MLSFRTYATLGGLMLCVAGHAARAQSPALSDSATLVKYSQALMDAIPSGDSSVWSAHLTDRSFITDEEGLHVGREEFLKDLRRLPAGQSGRIRVTNAHFVNAPGAAVL